MAGQLRVSAVVVTYNRRQNLASVIDRLLASEATYELVVVVNGSKDGSIEFLEERSGGDPRIRPLYNDRQPVGAARQRGVEYARGDVVAVFDDDVLVEPEAIEGHAKHHACHERSVLLGYMPIRLPERRRGSDFSRFFYQSAYEATVEQWEQHPEIILEGFWAGHFSLKRADALAVGLEDVGAAMHYHSDHVFGLRCKEAGLTGCFDRRLASEHAFSRDVLAFSRDAYHQGADRARLRELKTGAAGSGQDLLVPQSFRQKLWISGTRRAHLANVLERALQLGVAGTGQLRWFDAQTKAAWRLYRVGYLRGVRAALDADLELAARAR